MAERRRLRASCLDSIFFDAPIERGAAQSQGLGSLRNIAVAAAKNLADEQGFNLIDAHIFKRRRCSSRSRDGKVGRLNLLTAAEQHRALHRVFEFAHVARPGILHQLLHGGGREANHLLAIAGAVAVEKVRGQQRDVFAPVAQCRQVNLNGVDAEEQILTEVACLGLLVETGVGGAQNPHVHAPGLR